MNFGKKRTTNMYDDQCVPPAKKQKQSTGSYNKKTTRYVSMSELREFFLVHTIEKDLMSMGQWIGLENDILDIFMHGDISLPTLFDEWYVQAVRVGILDSLLPKDILGFGYLMANKNEEFHDLMDGDRFRTAFIESNTFLLCHSASLIAGEIRKALNARCRG